MDEGRYLAADRYLTLRHAAGLEQLCRFLAIPSISALPEHAPDVVRAARFLADRLRQVGCPAVELLDPGGHPVVYGAWPGAAGAPTALVYGHYDVQPVDPLEAWHHAPFAPVVADGKLYARGASDDKGQLWMHLEAAQALAAAAGRLPVNLKFLFEGEEETGASHLAGFAAAHRELLAADVLVISDTSFFAPGVPSVSCGLRGLAAWELVVHGPARDLHSGEFGGAVANPLHALAELLASLHDGEGRVAVAGFYDGVAPPDPGLRAELAGLPFEEDAFRRLTGAEPWGEVGYATLERLWLRPTLEVNGLGGGFQGTGIKTVLPASARAKLTARLVPGQDPARVLAVVEDHLRRRCPPGVRLELRPGGGSPAVHTPEDSPWVRAARRALERAFERPAMLIRSGGSIPVVAALGEALETAPVLLGFGLPDDAIHAPDERLDLEQYARGQRAIVAYWLELGAMRGSGVEKAR
ncbi:MAG: dipeptidase [Thermaerobacter sp.]|nr:dipeptidase [Thermaerobacter sp.]